MHPTFVVGDHVGPFLSISYREDNMRKEYENLKFSFKVIESNEEQPGTRSLQYTLVLKLKKKLYWSNLTRSGVLNSNIMPDYSYDIKICSRAHAIILSSCTVAFDRCPYIYGA